MRAAAALTDSPGLREEITDAIEEILHPMEVNGAGADDSPTTTAINGQNM